MASWSSRILGIAGALSLAVIAVFPPDEALRPWAYSTVALLFMVGALLNPSVTQFLKRGRRGFMAVLVFLLSGSICAFVFYLTAERQRLAPVDAVPLRHPTSLRLAFAGDRRPPTPDGQENIARWYAVPHSFQETDKDGNTQRTVFLSWFIAITFEQPIQSGAATLQLGFEGAAAPEYSVQDFSPRSAVVVVNGEIPRGVLVVRARYVTQ